MLTMQMQAPGVHALHHELKSAGGRCSRQRTSEGAKDDAVRPSTVERPPHAPVRLLRVSRKQTQHLTWLLLTLHATSLSAVVLHQEAHAVRLNVDRWTSRSHGPPLPKEYRRQEGQRQHHDNCPAVHPRVARAHGRCLHGRAPRGRSGAATAAEHLGDLLEFLLAVLWRLAVLLPVYAGQRCPRRLHPDGRRRAGLRRWRRHHGGLREGKKASGDLQCELPPGTDVRARFPFWLRRKKAPRNQYEGDADDEDENNED